jgi:hypothetical protein
MEDKELTPAWGCAATVERPYETIEDRELTPVWGCAATVERP